MKKHLLSVVALASLFVLAGCGNTSSVSANSSTGASTSAPASSSAPVSSSSSSSTDATVHVTGVTLDKTTASLIVSDTVTLTATVAPTNATNKTVAWTTSDATVATVKDGLVTAVKVGTATITATADGKSATCAVTVREMEISDITKTGTYTVKGVVSALTTVGYVINDGKASILVYLNAVPTVTIGTYVSVTGAVTKYNGAFQFGTTAVVSALTDTAPTVASAVALTADVLDGYKDAESYATTEIKKYSWTATAGKANGFVTLNMTGSDTLIEPYKLTTDFDFSDGYSYEVEGYFIGYNTKYSYASFIMTKSTAVVPTSLTVTAADSATSVQVTSTLQLSVAAAPTGAVDSVIWSTSDATKATVSDEGLVTGIGEGSVVITATSTAAATVKGSITLTVEPAPTTPVTGVTVDATTLSLALVGGNATHQIEATVAPAAANQSCSYVSDKATVATVSESGLITAVAAGVANITVTTIGVDTAGDPKTATIAVTVTNIATVTTTTIADLIAKDTSETDKVYEVSGILEGFSNTATSGNGYLTDPATGKTIKIYGSTTTVSAMSVTDGKYSFTNPKDAKTTLADFNNGEVVTMDVLYINYGGTDEISGIYNSHAASTNTYAVTKEATTNGTFATDKDAYAYGETVTITATPADGYKVNSVDVKNAQGEFVTSTVSATDDNVYTFVASCVNDVTITFKDASAAEEYLSFDFSKLTAASGDGYATNKGESSTVPAVYSPDLRLYGATGKTGGYFYTTVTTTKDIASVDVVCKKNKTTTGTLKADLFVSATNTFGATAEDSKEITSSTDATYTFAVSTAGSRYIKIMNNGTATNGATQFWISKITITLKA